MARKFYAVLAVISLIFISSSRFAPAQDRAASPSASLLAAEHVPDELILKLLPSPATNAVDSATAFVASKLGAKSVDSVRSLATDNRIQVVRLTSKTDLASALDILRAESSVEFAEPNYIYHTTAERADPGEPNDAAFGNLWGIRNSGQTDSAGQKGKVGADVNVLPIWAQGYHGSKKVVVAVIDTGMDWDHPELSDNLYTNPKEIAGNGKDDDGNGFIDDVHGWNFSANTASSRDDNKHGTHCSGTIGGKGNNAIGVAGVNWDVTIMPVKFLDAAGSGTLENAVNAINYARMMKVTLMSNSWGGGGYSEALLQSIKAARDAGILFVVAAGNDARNDDDVPTYPASYPVDNVLAVSATDNQDKLATFSSYGPKTIHVAAPGVNVYSTTPNNNYLNLSGTSMATPHVAGIAALLYSIHPEWTYQEIKQRLITTSDPQSALRRRVIAKGRVNAWNALTGFVPPSPDPDESLWRDVPQVIENPHNYPNGARLEYPVHVDNAKYIRVHFATYAVESGYDRIQLIDPAGNIIDDLTGKGTDLTSEYYKGDTLTVRLTSDGSVTDYGFKIDKVQVIQGP